MVNNQVAILTLPQILEYLKTVDLIPLIEEGFKAYAKGNAVVPPVGELLFENPPGDTHIKYGYIKGQEYYTVKIASGFYNNPALGLKASQGVVLLFSQKTGVLKCVLLDNGLLTDVRTAIASMITIKHLAPSTIDRVGIIGTGIQAKLQLDYLHQVTECKDICVWGRNIEKVRTYKNQVAHLPYNITITPNPKALAAQCQVIITTTAATEPILHFKDLTPGNHIVALGSDTAHKIELHPDIIRQADKVISDSITQSQTRGEVFRARKENCLDEDKLIELGDLLLHPHLGRSSNQEITIADLTGVAVQDIMISTAIYDHHLSNYK